MELLSVIGDWKLFKRNKYDHEKRLQAVQEFIPLTKDLFDFCPFKDYIFQGQEVLFIMISGSSLNGLIDEYSDYDLVVITKESYKPQVEYRISYNDRIMHWYYQTIEETYNNTRNFFIYYWGTFEYKFLTADNIIYLNQRYREAADLFLATKEILSNIGLYSIYSEAVGLINRLINCPIDKLDTIILKVYHIIAYAYLDHHKLEKDFNFLLRVKRMKYKPLSSSDLNRLIEILKNCLKKLPNTEYSISIVQTLKQEYRESWQECYKKLELY